MRRTVHTVSAGDYWPIACLVQPFIADAWRLTFNEDPYDAPLVDRLRPAHEAAIARMTEGPATSAELTELMAAAVPDVALAKTRSYLLAHLQAHVPLVIVPHDAERYGRSFYAVAAQWIGERPGWATEPDAALRFVAERYLSAFGPASVDDFTSYLGRRGSFLDRRRAVESLGDRLVRFSDEDGRELVDLAEAPRPPADVQAPARLLARWDSALLSHEPRRRTRILPETHRSTVITNNGDVLPTFLADGFVAGTWRLAETRADATIEMRPFGSVTRPQRAALEQEAERLAAFLAPDAARRGVRWISA